MAKRSPAPDTAPTTQPTTQPCCFCGAPNPVERVTEVGYLHCTARECVARYKRERHADMRVALMPKSGFLLLHKDDPFFRSGRSSGRT